MFLGAIGVPLGRQSHGHDLEGIRLSGQCLQDLLAQRAGLGGAPGLQGGGGLL